MGYKFNPFTGNLEDRVTPGDIGAVAKSGDTMTGNLTITGATFGSDHALTGAVGDARYGNFILVTKPSATTRTTDTIEMDPHLELTLPVGLWQIEIYMTCDAVGGTLTVMPGYTGGFLNIVGGMQFQSPYLGPMTGDMPAGNLPVANNSMYYMSMITNNHTQGTRGLMWRMTPGGTSATIRADARLLARKIG